MPKIPSIYVFASDNSMHVQRLVQGAARFTRNQSRILRLRWGQSMIGTESIERDAIIGIIYFALTEGDRDLLHGTGLPAVNVSSRNMPTVHPSVISDDLAVGKLAAAHFKDNLFQNFAFVGVKSHPYSLERAAGFKAGVFPSVCTEFWLDEYSDANKVSASLSDFLTSLEYPCAILASNDIFARRVCERAIDLNLAVPQQIAILGVDAEHMVSLSSPVQLSSIDIDSYSIGFKAAELLLNSIHSPLTQSQTLRIAPKGVVTATSTDHLATSDHTVALAVTLIREYACSGISVDELAIKTGIGRRVLERRFRQTLGKGIDEQIRKVRIERAMELLDRSDLTVSEIGDKCGFKDVFYFSKMFKKATGKSPRSFREG
ncbi:MAG: helix-turn-helix domain-containing protein [Verrucomicrobia bacterium]|nr:helix-turn-helix domain-containing protein [Verrucomicrobiota bacterium]